MPSFRYRALTQAGEMVSGSISATSASEVVRQVEYLGLVPIEAVSDGSAAGGWNLRLAFFNKPRLEDITIFTRDLALLLKAGARLDAALELLASDVDIGRLRPIIGKVRSSILSGESLAEAISHHPTVFPEVYVALVRVGEASGTLDHVLEVLAAERERGEALRRKLGEAMRYPAFILFASGCVLTFFLLFVLPQFAFCVARIPNQARSDRGLLPGIVGSGALARNLYCRLCRDSSGFWMAARRPSRRAAGCLERHDAPPRF